MYIDVEQIMLYLIRMDVIGDTLDAHEAKLFDTDAAADKLSQRLLTSNTFVAQL